MLIEVYLSSVVVIYAFFIIIKRMLKKLFLCDYLIVMELQCAACEVMALGGGWTRDFKILKELVITSIAFLFIKKILCLLKVI